MTVIVTVKRKRFVYKGCRVIPINRGRWYVRCVTGRVQRFHTKEAVIAWIDNEGWLSSK